MIAKTGKVGSLTFEFCPFFNRLCWTSWMNSTFNHGKVVTYRQCPLEWAGTPSQHRFEWRLGSISDGTCCYRRRSWFGQLQSSGCCELQGQPHARWLHQHNGQQSEQHWELKIIFIVRGLSLLSKSHIYWSRSLRRSIFLQSHPQWRKEPLAKGTREEWPLKIRVRQFCQNHQKVRQVHIQLQKLNT